MQNFLSRCRSLSRSSRTLASIAADTTLLSASQSLGLKPAAVISSGIGTLILIPSFFSLVFSLGKCSFHDFPCFIREKVKQIEELIYLVKLFTLALTSAGNVSILCAT
jgi:hypothetical protein